MDVNPKSFAARLYTITMENTNPQQDTKLSQYRFEMNDFANDGWSREHYKKMYEARLAQLLKEDRNSESESGFTSLEPSTTV